MQQSEIVHQAIWEQVPELRDALVTFEKKEVQSDLDLGVDPFITPYSLFSRVLIDPYLIPLIEDPKTEDAALVRCAQAIEQILEAGSTLLVEMVSIRANAYLLLEPSRWRRFREYAGPHLKAEVINDSQYYPWPYDEPVV